jgi:hypothetical protein
MIWTTVFLCISCFIAVVVEICVYLTDSDFTCLAAIILRIAFLQNRKCVSGEKGTKSERTWVLDKIGTSCGKDECLETKMNLEKENETNFLKDGARVRPFEESKYGLSRTIQYV